MSVAISISDCPECGKFREHGHKCPEYHNVAGNSDFDPLRGPNWEPLELPEKPCAGLSGGEVPEQVAALRMEMIQKISAESDVRAVIELAHRSDGTFLYMIETPFLNSFPRYVIGICDRYLKDVRPPLFRCGARWSADAEWHRQRHGENHHMHV